MVSITAYRKPRITHRGTGVTRTALKHLVESTGHALVNRSGHAIGNGINYQVLEKGEQLDDIDFDKNINIYLI